LHESYFPDIAAGQSSFLIINTPEFDCRYFDLSYLNLERARLILGCRIPGAEYPWAFLMFILFLVGIVAVQMLWFKHSKWFQSHDPDMRTYSRQFR